MAIFSVLAAFLLTTTHSPALRFPTTHASSPYTGGNLAASTVLPVLFKHTRHFSNAGLSRNAVLRTDVSERLRSQHIAPMPWLLSRSPIPVSAVTCKVLYVPCLPFSLPSLTRCFASSFKCVRSVSVWELSFSPSVQHCYWERSCERCPRPPKSFALHFTLYFGSGVPSIVAFSHQLATGGSDPQCPVLSNASHMSCFVCTWHCASIY